MNQIQDALNQISKAIAPIQQLGVLVRQAADVANVLGRLERNGTLTVVYNGDANFATQQSLGALRQEYVSQFVIVGRLLNLKSEEGLYAVRSLLYQHTVGLRLNGYAHPLRAEQFKLLGAAQGRAETSWDFQYVMSAPGLLLSELDGIGDRLLEPEVALAEMFFEDVSVEAAPIKTWPRAQQPGI